MHITSEHYEINWEHMESAFRMNKKIDNETMKEITRLLIPASKKHIVKEWFLFVIFI